MTPIFSRPEKPILRRHTIAMPALPAAATSVLAGAQGIIPSFTLANAEIEGTVPPSDEEPVYRYTVVVGAPACLTGVDRGKGHRRNGRRSRLHWAVHVPVAGYPVLFKIIEIRCRCGTRTPLPWLHPEHPGFTVEAIDYAIRQGICRPFAKVAQELLTHESVVRKLCLRVMLHLDRIYQPEAPEFLIIDEGHFGEKRRSKRSRIILVDGNGMAGRSLIDMGFCDTKGELRRLLLGLTNRERIKVVAMDGLQRYADVVREVLGEDVLIVYDRWHFQRDCTDILVDGWRDWYGEHAQGRRADIRAALQVDVDALRTVYGLSDAQKHALAALARVAPHLEAVRQWRDRQIAFYPQRDEVRAAELFDEARKYGQTVLREHGHSLSAALRNKFASLLKRIERRRRDLLNYGCFRLARPTRKDPLRTVGFGSSGAESYNRLIDQLNDAGNGLHPEVLRIKALANYGPLTEGVIREAITGAPPLPTAHKDAAEAAEKPRKKFSPWPKRAIPPLPAGNPRTVVRRSTRRPVDPAQMELGL